MAVVLSNADLRARTKPKPRARDEYGQVVGSAEHTEWGPAYPGAIKEFVSSDDDQGGVWNLRLDPAQWPLAEGDHVTDDGVRVWVVMTALLHQVPDVPDVDYVQVTAVLETPEV